MFQPGQPKQVILTKHVKFKWLLGEGNDSHSVREMKSTSVVRYHCHRALSLHVISMVVFSLVSLLFSL